MVDKISVPRGTADILPSEISLWQDIEKQARQSFHLYNYSEIRTPIFEEAKLFKRSLGQSSDVVNKQLLELVSSKEDGNALRPEGTASIVRSYIENRLDKKEGASKLYYIGPMFRGERPQKGRLRQFHQIGAEVIGPRADSALYDVEIIALCMHLLESFGVEGSELVINSLGSMKDKEGLSKLLRDRLKDHVSSLCEDCQNRFERNVFRILDCKNDKCQKVVSKLELDHSFLSADSQAHYDMVKAGLDSLGLQYREDAKLVRGLDYYTHTVFEITHKKLGSQDAICAGGRYNHLVKDLGGPEVSAIGFALGIERSILAIDKSDTLTESLSGYIVALDDAAIEEGAKILQQLRSAGVSCDMNFREGSMKSLMREADKSNAKHVIIIGESEMKNNKASVKNMDSGDQKEVAFDQLVEALKE